MENEKLAPPWVTFYNMMEKLFEQDDQVHLQFDEEGYVIKVFVDNEVKADALTKLLPSEKEFGNVVLKIEVIPANIQEPTMFELFERAFDGNEALSYLYTGAGPCKDISYIVFQPELVQFFNDQLDDINGLKTTVYAEIAKEIFGQPDGIFFCTDAIDESLEIPLGEWP